MTTTANRVTPSSILIYPLAFATGTAVFAAAGWLGSHIVKIFVPSVIPAAHAIAVGLLAPASLAIYLLASRINKKGGAANYPLSIIGGYFAAIYATKALGFAVTFHGPFVGLIALSVPVATVIAFAAPIAIALLAITNAGKSLRDFLLHGG